MGPCRFGRKRGDLIEAGYFRLNYIREGVGSAHTSLSNKSYAIAAMRSRIVVEARTGFTFDWTAFSRRQTKESRG
jgi:hypothetical protein